MNVFVVYTESSNSSGKDDKENDDDDVLLLAPTYQPKCPRKEREGCGYAEPEKEYNEYISLLDDNEFGDALDEDADFLAAIEASLSEYESVQQGGKEKIVETAETCHGLVDSFVKDTMEMPSNDDGDQFVNIIVRRKFIYESTARAIQRKSFSFFKPFI